MPQRLRQLEHWLAHDCRLADFAIRFLRTYRTQPFAMFFQPFRPHSPYVPVPDEDWEPYRGKTLRVPEVPGVDPAHQL